MEATSEDVPATEPMCGDEQPEPPESAPDRTEVSSASHRRAQWVGQLCMTCLQIRLADERVRKRFACFAGVPPLSSG